MADKQSKRRKAVNKQLKDIPAPGAVATRPLTFINKKLGSVLKIGKNKKKRKKK